MSMRQKRPLWALLEAEDRLGGGGAISPPEYLAGNVDSEIDKIIDLRTSILEKTIGNKGTVREIVDKFESNTNKCIINNNRADAVRDYKFITATDKNNINPAGQLADPRNMLAFHRILGEQTMAHAYRLTGPGEVCRMNRNILLLTKQH